MEFWLLSGRVVKKKKIPVIQQVAGRVAKNLDIISKTFSAKQNSANVVVQCACCSVLQCVAVKTGLALSH